jgi:CheY-like chemotaxis protein
MEAEPHRSVLVVDDDRDIRETLEDVLAGEGFSVAAAANGKEALDYLRGSRHPCVILLDLMMPVLDGWGFRNAQVADPSLKGIPVVVLSAAPDRRGLFEQTPVLQKPVSLDRLIGTISRYC